MTMPDDYNLIYIRMPGDVRGCVRTDADGYPTIYINVDLSPEGRREALDHELAHLARGDFDSHLTIWEAETGELHTSRVAFALRADPMWRRQLTAEEFIAYMYVGYQLMKKWDQIDTLPLPERLKAYRWGKRLSREQAASWFGVTEHEIWEFEAGKADPPEDVLREMQRRYGMEEMTEERNG